MKVVITGASGNLGSAALRELSADGEHEVIALARRRPEVENAGAASVRWHPADVSRDDLTTIFTGVDAVVHLAWKFQPTHRQDVTWRTNAVGTRRVLDAVAEVGVPAVVCASSVAAYSPVDHDTPVDETWLTDGASEATYCREKAYVERTLDGFEASHPDTRVVRLRPAFAFQRSAASEQRRIFGGALARPALLDRRRIPIVPVPSGLRLQAVHAGDVARAIAAAVERPVSGAFNLAGEGVLRRDEIGDLMGAKTVEVPPGLVQRGLDAAWRLHAVPVPGSLFNALMHVPLMSTGRARTELGWTPRHSGRDAVNALLEGMPQRAGSTMPPLHP
ncbi:NAD-dependent epimerase/dehydratase family protein [Aeromicrobium duanguangcaii]|uniref:NAD-dependent epimerase/dehydratase family protein n=1 Tax=Aeromicrobium duanguangcaii TaxID=2968086 RepID=A0ABY5KBE9_9ACTN|nr:NAD-dependent epimerase/dehydratase family protein [Aeromicrobium duanguangcaii]MCD9154819.1 NAD-dependent epimerase/dehydratase family protein [Aeromicrobium duanguangcaii]UUI67767.1 NAD-dependent epimerase/dehydratase family protein [Aeromicrobium duanguangcaii]